MIKYINQKFLFNSNGFKNYRLLWINRLIVLLAFMFAFGETHARALMAFIFLLWITVIKREEVIATFKKPVIFYFFIFISTIWLSIFYIPGEHIYAFKFLERFLVYLLIPMIMISTSVRKDYITQIITSFILGMIANEIVSYGILFHLWLHPTPDGFPVYFMHHVFYSILLSYVLMLLVYRFLHEKKIMFKIIEGFFIFTMFGNLILSGGRTGQIPLIATFILTFLIYKKVTFKMMVSVIVIPIIIFSITYKVYTPFQARANMFISDTQSILNKGDYNTSFGNRVFAYVITAKMLEVNDLKTILIGVGIDDVQNTKIAFIKKYFPNTPNMQSDFMQFHSSYVDVVWWVGLVGLVFVILFLISILRIKVQDHQMRYIKISLFFILLFAYLPDSSLDNQYIMIMTALFVGLLLAQEKYESISDSKREYYVEG